MSGAPPPTTIMRIGKRRGWRIFTVFFGLALISLGIVCVLLNLPSYILYGSLALFVIPVYTLKDRMRTDYNELVRGAETSKNLEGVS